MGQEIEPKALKAIRVLKILLADMEIPLAGQRVRLLDGELVAVLKRCDSQLVPVEDAYVPFDLTLSGFIKAAKTVNDEDLYIGESAAFVANAERALTQINREGGPSRMQSHTKQGRQADATGTPSRLPAGHTRGTD